MRLCDIIRPKFHWQIGVTNCFLLMERLFWTPQIPAKLWQLWDPFYFFFQRSLLYFQKGICKQSKTEIFMSRTVLLVNLKLQQLHQNNTLHYNMVMDTTHFKDESKKFTDYLKNYHKWSFFFKINTLSLGYKMTV